MDLFAPPEITSVLIHSGPGAGTLLAASAAWTNLATQMEQFAQDQTQIVSSLNSWWRGHSYAAMAASSATISAWARSTAANAALSSTAASSAAAAYEAVHGSITHPSLVFSNRTKLSALIATNFLGQNLPAIIETETEYAQMWAQNISSMIAYQAASAQAVSILNPFEPLVSSITSIIAPGSSQTATGLSGLLNLLSGSTGSSLGVFINSNLFTTAFINSLVSSGFYTPSNALGPFLGLIAGSSVGQAVADSSGGSVPGACVPEWGPLSATVPCAENVTAGMGSGQPLGRLTVPPGWTKMAPPSERVLPPPVQVISKDQETPFPLLMPFPLAAAQGAKSSSAPRYGTAPTVMLKHPYGG